MIYTTVPFTELQHDQVELARTKHSHNITSRHEALGVIEEEVHEFMLEVFAQHPTDNDLLTELLHIAAMCQRAAEDLQLTPTPEMRP